MSKFTIICSIQWILLYFSAQLLSLKADNCFGSNSQTCGNLAIPYPFRLLGSTCGLPGFEIACENKSSSHPGTPYLPILPRELVKVLNMSYDHILVDAAASYALPCNKPANKTITRTFNLSDGGPFRISEFNNFFVVGCSIYGKYRMSLATGPDAFMGSCYSSCNQTRSVKPLACKDNSCCKIPVPGGYTRMSVSAEFLSFNETRNCSHSASALVDRESFGSNPGLKFQFEDCPYSMRLDWAIPGDTCPSDKANNSYQCSPNAECENKSWGYVCKCKIGYSGDGYKKGMGCREIEICTSFGCFQTSSIIAGLLGILIAVLLGGGTLFWILKLRQSKRVKERNFQKNGGDHLERLISSRGVEGMKLFSLNEIEKATNKFSQNLILGTGGNVVKLLGCCLETAVPLLVYEYISNGTLFDHLHDNKEEHQQVPWEQRLRIATETAEALSYLHSAASVPIVHRDVKSSNILLDNDYNPKVADFGVSRLVPMGQTHITTVVQGTMGYLDPEYFQTVQLTEKSDVYSFGVVLVELLTGLKPVSYERMKNQSNLAIFFLSTVNTTGFREIIDPRLDVDEGKNMESMRRVAALAKECLSVEGEKRPSMKEVVQELLWSKGGERPHAWVNNDVADNPEEMVGLIVVDEKEKSEGIRAAYSIPEQCSSSFSIEGLRADFRSGR
ncbi:hypothetical protein SUGI_0063610 [Cryptomeria japonica]|nr:hypothetical protein SUGI_0063610 [Cryptomeria japonica]